MDQTGLVGVPGTNQVFAPGALGSKAPFCSARASITVKENTDMPDLTRVLSELDDATRDDRARLTAAAPAPPAPEQNLGLAFRPGAKVRDLVTGQTGEIIRGESAHLLVPTARQ